MSYLLGFALALSLSLALTPLVKKLAFALGAVDKPGDPRKIHSRPIARLGGVAIFAAFVATTMVNFQISRQLVGLLAGVSILLVVGIIDDRRGLSPWVKLCWQIVAAAAALTGGIGITTITNPLGGVIHLNAGRFAVDWAGLHFHVTPIANALTIVWLVGLINTINFLDGLDGLACGVSGIAAIIMFMLSVGPRVNSPEVALLAIILAGAALGFLPYNFFPAKIFLGDSGAYFLGLTLGLLAIYSGAKLATAALVLGFTIIDGLWTVVRRVWRRTSPFKADRGHLHHLLLDAGLSQRHAVLLLYVLSLGFGLLALLSGSFAKLIGFVVLLLLMTVLISSLNVISLRRGRLK